MKIQLTQELYAEMVERIERLEKVELPANSKAISAAREQGDLSENAEYHEAKERQGKLIHELETLKAKVEHAELIQENQDTDFVKIGHTITVKRKKGNQISEKKLKLVGEWDKKASSTSSDSLLGSALIGKSVGETFEYKPDVGTVEVTILSIEND